MELLDDTVGESADFTPGQMIFPAGTVGTVISAHATPGGQARVYVEVVSDGQFSQVPVGAAVGFFWASPDLLRVRFRAA